ncbi:MAG: bifunctional (p)ppGpp synthetase/guanosine-3',5'-bis(diphosphate) 3'-pyrophosphohydrolase, partial [Ruminiclostridium sp.]|nr:bifunctional (p)ppGpp synthetase/guanosine-3',5'-bis(diphosphate) 3'-pyrophosphohydrolase [Ruminiclostridium sp.]
EILTSSNVHGPSRDWLKMAKSSQARNKISQWFKNENREENVVRGKDNIERELKKQGMTYSQLFKTEWIEIVLKKFNFNSLEDLYSAVGYGGITSSKVVTKLRDEYRKTIKVEEPEHDDLEEEAQNKTEKKKRKLPESGIVVKGIENCLVRLSRCCNPVPGDEITGYITRGRGVSVHRSDCTNITGNLSDDGRLIEVKWYSSSNVAYKADINIMANDRPSILMEVTNVIAEAKIHVKAINARTTKDQLVIINLTLEINDAEQLEKIIKKLKKVDSVFEVSRSKQ